MKDTQKEIERLKKLVKAQKRLIGAMNEFLCCMPTCIEDMVPDYRRLADEIERLGK